MQTKTNISTARFRGSPQELVKTSNIDDSVRWRFWVHSAVDTQRMDGDSGVAGVPGISARAGRRGEDPEAEESRHFGLGENMRPDDRACFRKLGCIGNET